MVLNRITGIVVFAAMVAFSVFAFAADPRGTDVSEKHGEVIKQNKTVDANQEGDLKFADSSTQVGGKTTEVKKDFSRPKAPFFRVFNPNNEVDAALNIPWKFVDLIGSPNGAIDAEVIKIGNAFQENKQLIKTLAMITKARNAGTFWFHAEGNLERGKGGGKGSGGTNPFWVAKVHDLDAIIVPADTPQQRGVTGDLVPSIKGVEGQKHYVSPQKAKEFVVLKAVVDGAGMNNVAMFQANFRWEPKPMPNTDVQMVPGKPDHVKVRRDAAKQVSIKIVKKAAGSDVDLMNVWLVHASIKRINFTPQIAGTNGVDLFIQNNISVGLQSVGVVKKIGSGGRSQWGFKATIKPNTIFNLNADIPNLTGKHTIAVPGGSKKHFFVSIPLANGVEAKWDMSRQVRARVKSPQLHWRNWNVRPQKTWQNLNLPKANVVFVKFPASEVEGNDDPFVGAGAQDNNPYSAQEQDLSVIPKPNQAVPKAKVGEMTSIDSPFGPLVPNSPNLVAPAGQNQTIPNGWTVELHMQFIEFVRLQIGSKWYLISDQTGGQWRFQAKLKYDAAKKIWVDNGSAAKPDHSDWK